MERDSLHDEQVVATGVSWDDYMARYAHDRYEWVDGAVVKMTPIHDRHNSFSQYFVDVFRTYFALKPIGRVLMAPFVMKLPAVSVSREPDLQVILNDNLEAYTSTGMLGPADIAIEIVSPESEKRDYVIKRSEYERGGVREYWIIDPVNAKADFYRRNADGKYIQPPLNGSLYETPLLPRLQLDTDLLWQDTLPSILDITRQISAMLAD